MTIEELVAIYSQTEAMLPCFCGDICNLIGVDMIELLTNKDCPCHTTAIILVYLATIPPAPHPKQLI